MTMKTMTKTNIGLTVAFGSILALLSVEGYVIYYMCTR